MWGLFDEKVAFFMWNFPKTLEKNQKGFHLKLDNV